MEYGSLEFWVDRCDRLQVLELDHYHRQYELSQIFVDAMDAMYQLSEETHRQYIRNMYFTCASSSNY